MTVPGIDKSKDGTHAFAMTARYHMPICTTCGIPEIAYRLGDMAFKKLSCEEFRKQIGAEDARCPKCGSDCVDVDFYESGDITSFVCRNCHAKFRREISLYDPNGDHDYSYVLKDEPEVKMERVKCPKCGKTLRGEWDGHYPPHKYYCFDCDYGWGKADEEVDKVQCPKCGSTEVFHDSSRHSLTAYCNRCEKYFDDGGNRPLRPISDLDKTPLPPRTVEVPIDISDETFMIIARMAHEKDITLNQLVTDILRKQMDKEDKEKGLYTKNLHDQYTNEVDLQSGFTYVNWLEQKLYDGKQK